jgi:hypothetical protein
MSGIEMTNVVKTGQSGKQPQVEISPVSLGFACHTFATSGSEC